MTPSIWQLLIVLVIVLLLFGRGKIPQLMGDMARGIKSFKKEPNFGKIIWVKKIYSPL